MKVFNRKQSNFDLGTSMGTGPKLIFFSSAKNLQSSGVPIKLLTQKNICVVSLQKFRRVLGQRLSDFQ